MSLPCGVMCNTPEICEAKGCQEKAMTTRRNAVDFEIDAIPLHIQHALRNRALEDAERVCHSWMDGKECAAAIRALKSDASNINEKGK